MESEKERKSYWQLLWVSVFVFVQVASILCVVFLMISHDTNKQMLSRLDSSYLEIHTEITEIQRNLKSLKQLQENEKFTSLRIKRSLTTNVDKVIKKIQGRVESLESR